MQEVTKQYRTETGHRLHEYDGKCAHLHGHSYLWEVTVVADKTDYLGMVVDFSVLKNAMELTIGVFDHAMVLHEKDPAYPELDAMRASNGKAQRVIAFPWNPTAENFAVYAGARINALLRGDAAHEERGVRVARVTVWETATSSATWEAL